MHRAAGRLREGRPHCLRAGGESAREDALVGERLAACANLVRPIRSIYRWQGEICRDDEHLMLIKTTREHYASLEARVKTLHSYEVPEIVAVPIAVGSAAYLGWLRDVTGDQ